MNFKLQLLGPLALLLFFLLFGRQAGAQTGALRGAVIDPSGAVVPGAQIALAGAGGTVQTKSGADGRYAFRGLASGSYTLSVAATGFAPLTLQNIRVDPGQVQELNLPLVIATERQEVTVAGQNREVGINPEQNLSAMVLSGSALGALSDDPDELRNELQALAGPAAGPNGGQIYIDGFAGGQLPPKSSILEVRVNQNPFSAEFDRLGYGRVEIITKPGAQKFQGSLAARGTTSALNTANPLVAEQPSYYQYAISGNIGGPIGKNASCLLSGFYMTRKNQAIVDALNPQDTNSSILEAFPTPIDYVSINPRFDFQLGQRQTVSIRDSFYRTYQTGSGVGTLDLTSQASNVLSEENALQLGYTILVNSRFVNETHFQWSHIYNDQVAANPAPTVTVQGAFTAGGSNAGIARDRQDNFELQNYSTAAWGAHTLRFGTRLRLYDDSSFSTDGANGAYTFDSIPAYLAGTPSQYSAAVISNPLASVLLFDGSLFFQDDWRAKPNFFVSAGLRFEGQNRIHDHADWAPRLAIAWSPKGNGNAPAKTVIRAGYGWFYNRFTVPNFFSANSGTPYVLEALHDNRINQQSYVIDNPDFYDPTAAATLSVLSAAGAIPSYHTVDAHFRAALDMQAGIGVDRQLSSKITANVTYLYTQGVHQYLTNNVSAPAFDASTYTVTGPTPGIYNYQFQAGGIYRQNQLIFTASVQTKHVVLNGVYTLNEAKSDTQGVTYTPSVAQDPELDYGRASFGYRHLLLFYNSYTGPYGIVFASELFAQSGTPYNLTVGDDLTANNQFNARPTYGVCGAAGVIATRYGCLDSNPAGKSERMVPYGVGTGPASAVYHVRLSKVIGVGPRVGSAGEGTTYQQSGINVRTRGLGGGSAPIQIAAATPRRYSLTLVVNAANLFNMVNLGTPNGVLLSPLFNKTQSLAPGAFGSTTPGNRSISFQASFSF
ncbi:MAG: carboxypeptidase regulatory-like domain-containing protein [Terracidiphilus sp.]